MNIKEKLDLGALYINQILGLNSCSFQRESEFYEGLIVPLLCDSRQLFINTSAFKEFLNSMEIKSIYDVTDQLGVKWVFVSTFEWITIIGPYRSPSHTRLSFQNQLLKRLIPANRYSDFERYYKTLFPLTDDVVFGAAFALSKSIYGDTDSTAMKHIALSSSQEQLLVDNSASKPVHFVEYTYDLQKRFMEEVFQGNTAQANLLLKEIASRTSNDSTAPLLNLKIAMAIVRTEIRIAAMNAGVPSQALDSLSSDFAKRFMNSASIEEVSALSYEMVNHFCALVRQYRLQSFGPIVRKSIHYILMNLSYPLRVTEIAQSLNITPNYLSSVFQREVGISITSYIRKLRLEKAAHLLTSTTAAVQEISISIGIIDNNYFTKLFKQEYKKTPTEYRQEYVHK